MLQAPRPQPNETHEQYTVRAHRELLALVPDPDQRNTMVWSAWEHERGLTPAQQRAQNEFGNERFIHSPNHCYFVEHETVDSQGQPVQFSLGDLVEIEQTCNKRASDRKAFSAIADNHTSPTDQSHAGDPPILGHVGAYKIGMVGHDEPKFAIFADEFHRADKAQILKDKPRRSIELVTFHNTGERFIDPVAALGGRAPRLPMPSRYSVACYSATGSLISRYQLEGPAMVAGPSNTHIKSTDFFSDTPNHESSMITDDDISKLVNAISNMPELSWVREQMEAQNGGAVSPEAPGGMDDVGGPNYESLDGPDDGPEDTQVDRNAAFQGGASGHNVITPPSEDSMYDEQQRFSAAYHPGGNMNGYVTVEQYNAMAGELNAVKASHTNLLKQFGATATRLSHEKSDATRRARIEKVCSDFPGIWDANEECSRLLYSAGANVSDEVFASEIQRMEAVANRVSIQQNTIPKGTIYRANEGSTIERNSAWYEKSEQLQLEAANRGEFISYDDLAAATDAAMAKR